jgi:hypothetical protein
MARTYHWHARLTYREWNLQFEEPPRGNTVQNAYAVWVGQPVILQLAAAADLRIPLRGIIIGETEEVIRFRVQQAWDIDIYKNMILAVEEDRSVRILVN